MNHPSKSHRCPSRHQRSAYTLAEMITVQAIFIGLIALSWPALRGSLQKNELVDAARRVRTELLKTRQTTMETGVAHQFRYETDGSQFEILPVESIARDVSPRGGQAHSATVAAKSVAAATNDVDSEATAVKSRTLPGEIKFAVQVAAGSARAEGAREEKPVADAAAAGEQEWAAPICFYPNGRSSNARIRLHGRDGHFVELALRGITGTVALSEVRHDVPEAERTEVR